MEPMSIEMPAPPTLEEIAEFEAWKTRYKDALEEGERRGWLRYHQYCDGAPEPYDPSRRHKESVRLWEREQYEIERIKRERFEKEQRAIAEKVAEEARQKVLREAGLL